MPLNDLILPHICACPKPRPWPWISDAICHGIFHVKWFEMRGDSSFCW
jgi:hypothetical protein